MSNRKYDKQKLLETALEMARDIGYTRVSRMKMGGVVGCEPSLIPYHFGTMAQFQRAIMGEAIRVNDLIVIAQGLIAKDPRAQGLPDDVKRLALGQLL
jgi:hypothetical protein